jgi:molecular chaperone GrpE
VNEERGERATPADEPADVPAGPTGARAEERGAEGAPEADRETAAPTGAPAEESPAVLRDRWLRAEAELQNYRRRATREREEVRRSAEEAVMLEVLAALDDLDRALSHAAENGVPEAWIEGVRMVGGRLVDYLARQGVVPEDPLGQPFDPAVHEAILELDSAELPPGHVAQVVRRGWRRGDRALRAARVVVARAPREGA